MSNQRGNVYVEYFVLALLTLLATIAFYNNGNFLGARASLEQGFDAAAARIIGP